MHLPFNRTYGIPYDTHIPYTLKCLRWKSFAKYSGKYFEITPITRVYYYSSYSYIYTNLDQAYTLCEMWLRITDAGSL